MIRNLKILGLALASVLALVVPAASAADFQAASAPLAVSGTGTSPTTFKLDPGEVQCINTSFTGSQENKKSATQAITPTYEFCTLKGLFGNISVTVNFNGCDFLFNASGHTEIKCPEGKNVVISGPGCTITIPGQTIASAVSYSNNAAKTDYNVHAAATGMTYSYNGFTCGSGTKTTNGTYGGDVTMKGKSGGADVSVWHE